MFATPYGCYRFKCLPFVLFCAGDLFQAKIDEIFSDMRDSTQGIADDILAMMVQTMMQHWMQYVLVLTM